MQVVVTGIGLVSALGQSTRQTWKNLLAGHSGIRRHSIFPNHPDVLLGMVGVQPSSIDSLLQVALQEALVDAELASLPTSTGVVLGSSRGPQSGIESIARQDMPLKSWLSHYEASPSMIVAQMLNLQGPVLAPRAACATGLWAIAQGADLIRYGFADVVIAGGVEAPITPLTVAGFQKMGALSDQGAAPFDLNRSGFVLGEGAAILVLESENSALRRGHRPYGNVLGFGSSADGFHVSAPSPDGDVALKAVQQCFQRSQINGRAIDFIHTHGTGTKLNDINESQIIQRLCPHAPPCTSSKGALGHTLGASGAIGSAICLLGFKNQVLPPCIGLKTPDPLCDIHLLTESYPCDIQAALCLSFGFGGQNAAIAFSNRRDL